MSDMAFAKKLKQLREAAGLSQASLATRAGMNVFGVAKLEQGVREPAWATVQALAKALGVDCTAFAGCDDVQADGDAPAARPGPAARERKPPAKSRHKRT